MPIQNKNKIIMLFQVVIIKRGEILKNEIIRNLSIMRNRK
jgi:hypothetical protein